MRKLLPFAIALAVIFGSCKKKSNPSEDDNLDELFKLEYSKLSTEEHKQKLEEAGINFIQKINTLPDEKFVSVLSYLSDLDPNTESSSMSSMLSIGESAGKKDVKGMFRATTSTEESGKLSDYYAIYTWNHSTQQWVESSSSSKLEYRFPSDETKTTNNAVLTLSYVPSNVKRTVDGESTELPASITGLLKVDNEVALSFTSFYTYRSDGTPSKVDMKLVMGSFSFKVFVDNGKTNFSSGFSFLKGSETLISLNTSVNGDLTFSNADEAENIGDILNNANATFEIMNIKLAGQVDIEAIADAESASDNLSDSLRNVKNAESWNKYAKFVAINTTDNTVMAKTEFIPVSDPYCYTQWNQNGTTQVCESDYYLEPRLIFKDNSKLSFDAFIEDGFSQLIDELDDFGEKFK